MLNAKCVMLNEEEPFVPDLVATMWLYLRRTIVLFLFAKQKVKSIKIIKH
jgi:hypothetical protein